jgi:hypothetical protein
LLSAAIASTARRRALSAGEQLLAKLHQIRASASRAEAFSRRHLPEDVNLISDVGVARLRI